MKKSIIEEIFYGERGHHETIKQSKEYWEIIKRIANLSNELFEDLSEAQKKLFDEFSLENMSLTSETALTYFTEGFKIGLSIAVECLEK